jgi:hypothetical protein
MVLMKSKKVFLSFISIFLIFFAKAYAFEDLVEKRYNFWPLGVYSKNKIRGYERKEFLGPFIYKYQFESENGTSYRPFYSSVEQPDTKKAYFLSPLGVYSSDNETTTFKLIPLINKKIEKVPSEEKEGSKWEYFPVFFGKTAQNETYGGVFPFYGHFKDRFGREEITFILWPFYSKVTYEKYTAQNILWPFIRIAKAKSKEDQSYGGFKFWPFYGHFREGEEERKFILWPFYIKTHYKDDAGNFEEKVFYFPFYGKERTDAYEKTIYLWPFFQKTCGYDPFYEQIDAPWPFYRSIRGKEITGKRFWPFYGYVKKADSLDSFLLWPFYFYKEDTITHGNSTYFEKEHRFLLLSKENEIFENNTQSRREFRFWPFYYSYEDYKKDLKIHYFPALLPLHDEGLERNYGPLLKIFENFEKGDYQFIKILWGLYRYEKIASREVHELAFLLRAVKDKETNYIEVLEGLLGMGKIDKKPVLKLLFINILNTNQEVQNVPQDRSVSGNL